MPKWQWGVLTIFRTQWNSGMTLTSHVEELIALTGDYRVARAAYEEAVKRRPGRIRDIETEDAIVSRIAADLSQLSFPAEF